MNLFIILAIILLPIIAQVYVNTTYNKYSKINNSKQLTGYDAAKSILDKNGLKDMYIVQINGNLTDHYDPKRKTLRLSKGVYSNTSIASIAVAAHEVGHALQDKENYSYFKIRNFLFPIVKFTSSLAYITILGGLIFELMNLTLIGLAFVLVGLIFQGINLPLEFNASSRAIKELNKQKLLTSYDNDGVEKMLKAAAFTYVAGMLASILDLLRLFLIFNNND
ncbi:MAG: zinc metallopeptidase [Bacilli bacterium]